MGILVANGTLPSGVQVSNVYMSFSDETIQVQSIPTANNFVFSTSYRVFADPSKVYGSNIRVPIRVIITQPEALSHPYTFLYQQLKTLYPDNTDWFENSTPTEPSMNNPLL